MATLDPQVDSCIALLVRHGATPSNIADPPILQGNSVDHSLSDVGQEQAERTSRYLAGLPISACFASHLRRAQETAIAIARPHDLDVQLIANFSEIDVGRWEGRSWTDISADEPELYQNYMSRPDLHGYPGGENLVQLRDRVVPALQAVMREHLGQLIVIVGHNVVNRCLIADTMGLPLAESQRVVQTNCGINVIRLRHDKLQVRSVNSTFHL